MAAIFGTNSADALRGTSSADAIYGLWGDDSIRGGDGRDFIYAGNGNDTVDGGAGSNVLDGGGGFDLVLYSEVISPIWADFRSGIVSFSGQTGDTMTGIEAIDGGTGRDTFIGDGASNLFRGNAGNDTLVGNLGSDTLVGGIGSDSLDGGNGQDSLVGGFGDDTMRGGLHDDIFFIGPIGTRGDGDTVDLVDFGRDLIDGGAGSDTLVISGPVLEFDQWEAAFAGEAPVARANLGTGILRLGDSANRSTMISIESIETGSGADSINGSSGDNFISAGDGANVVYGGAGNDTIIGGHSRLYFDGGVDNPNPAEILNGGSGNDLIFGNGSVAESATDGVEYPGTDILAGGDGNDTIHGGSGIQIISGGSGRDVFVLTDEYATTNGTPTSVPTTISDFERGQDRINFEISADEITFIGEGSAGSNVGDLSYSSDGTDTNVFLRLLHRHRDCPEQLHRPPDR